MEIKEFPPEVILGNPRASDVVSKDNGDVVGDGFFRTVDDSLKYYVSIELLHFCCIGDGTVKQRVW